MCHSLIFIVMSEPLGCIIKNRTLYHCIGVSVHPNRLSLRAVLRGALLDHRRHTLPRRRRQHGERTRALARRALAAHHRYESPRIALFIHIALSAFGIESPLLMKKTCCTTWVFPRELGFFHIIFIQYFPSISESINCEL